MEEEEKSEFIFRKEGRLEIRHKHVLVNVKVAISNLPIDLPGESVRKLKSKLFYTLDFDIKSISQLEYHS